MDDADKSFNEEQEEIRTNLYKVKNKPYIKLIPLGYCYNCFEDTDGKKLFCNDKCATEYDLARRYNFS